jgi:hypothetical protein
MVGLSLMLSIFMFSSSEKRSNAQLRRHQPHQTAGEGCLERAAVEFLPFRRIGVTTQPAWSTVHQQ